MAPHVVQSGVRWGREIGLVFMRYTPELPRPPRSKGYVRVRRGGTAYSWYRIVAMCALLTAGCSTGETMRGGSCAAPFTQAEKSVLSPGQPVAVSAFYLWSGCADYEIVDEDGSVTREEMHLVRDAPVMFTQNDRTEELARVDAHGDIGTAKTTVTVPDWAETGPAQLQIGLAEPATVQVSEDQP